MITADLLICYRRVRIVTDYGSCCCAYPSPETIVVLCVPEAIPSVMLLCPSWWVPLGRTRSMSVTMAWTALVTCSSFCLLTVTTASLLSGTDYQPPSADDQPLATDDQSQQTSAQFQQMATDQVRVLLRGNIDMPYGYIPNRVNCNVSYGRDVGWISGEDLNLLLCHRLPCFFYCDVRTDFWVWTKPLEYLHIFKLFRLAGLWCFKF